ncbi:MAG TPA: homoserine O-acetyltransferase [Methanomassiliicoccales archaeon]|jgi:homoserine O-acetyltransferase
MKSSDGSVGIVETKSADITKPLSLESGQTLSSFRIAYETYGKLNKEKNNAILICHALSGDAHAAGYHEGDTRPGWWDSSIGPGKGFDTSKFFVICSNVLGGCKGSTGPSSPDPETGRPYGIRFPVVTIKDMVNAQMALVEHLGIDQLFAVAGGSMGGMQVLQWAITYPDRMKRAVVIASSAYSSPQQIAFNAVGRRAIITDPEWNGGDYYGKSPPSNGLSLARMIGHITYLSDESMYSKFGRRLQDKETIGYDFNNDFQVESYLSHQGDSFVKRFDANSYLYVTKAIDYFDLNEEDSLIRGLSKVRSNTLVIAVSSDWLYPPYQSQEIVTALSANNIKVKYAEIKSNYGHDAFLVEPGQLNYHLRQFLGRTVVGDLMSINVPTVSEGSTIQNAARIMLDLEVNHLPVLDTGGKLVGIVTSWDIARAVAMGYSSLLDIISRPVLTARPDEEMEEAASRMEQYHITALPVVDDHKRVLGLISVDKMGLLFGGGIESDV